MTISLTRRAQPAPTTSAASVASAVLAAGILLAVFKLALSDGGRDLDSLALVQTVALALLALVIAAGRTPDPPLGRALLAMIAAVVLTSAWSVRPEASAREAVLWMTYAAIGLVTAVSVSDGRGALRVADGLVVVAGWLCLVALFMFWGSGGNTAIRWHATFYWPNPFAAFLLLLLPLAAVRMLRARAAREALAHGGAVMLLGIAFIFTSSRGAWLSAALAAPAALAVLKPPSWPAAVRRASYVALCLVAAVILLTRIGPGGSRSTVVTRAASIADSADPSIQGRLNFWRSALRIFADHPQVGTGPGTFGAAHAAYQRDARYYARDAHNLYVQTAAEMGVVGIAALGALLAVIATTWIRALRRAPGGEEYSLAAGVGAGLLAFFIHSAVDMDWSFPANPAMAFALVGLLAAAARGSRENVRPCRSTASARTARIAAVAALLAAIAAVQGARIANAQFVHGQVLARAGRWEEAGARYAEASRWNPLSARYLGAQAGAAMQVNPPRYDLAETALRRAMMLDRMNASHVIQLAQLVIARGRPVAFREAADLLLQAISLDPTNRPEAYRLLARLYRTEGQTQRAEEVYQRAAAQYRGRGLAGTMMHVLLWPEVVALHADWAELLLSQRRAADAAGVLSLLLAEDPSIGTYAVVADVWSRAGERDRAAAALREGLVRYPGDERLRARLRALGVGIKP